MTAPGREAHLVELVDAEGRTIGRSTVDEAHRLPGRLHRAFSVMLVDDNGRILLQRRAAEKTRFPMRWANTCCGHPAPGEGLAEAATARLAEEVGITGVTLEPVGAFTYRAVDPATGRVEYEYDHVLLGRAPAEVEPAPDPSEVADLRWESPTAVRLLTTAAPDDYAPWLSNVLSVLHAATTGTRNAE